LSLLLLVEGLFFKRLRQAARSRGITFSFSALRAQSCCLSCSALRFSAALRYSGATFAGSTSFYASFDENKKSRIDEKMQKDSQSTLPFKNHIPLRQCGYVILKSLGGPTSREISIASDSSSLDYIQEPALFNSSLYRLQLGRLENAFPPYVPIRLPPPGLLGYETEQTEACAGKQAKCSGSVPVEGREDVRVPASR
jgi:hypothetical protein